MRQVTVARLACAVSAGALLLGGSARAADIGANDDTGKYLDDSGASLYEDMAGLGLRQIVLTSRFKPSEPMTIQDKALLDRTIPAASAAGIKVVLAVYPYPPREVEAGIGSPSLFGSHVGALASIYPEVRQFVVGNEPNQPAFWRPQFNARGRMLSAPAFGQYLATAYDSLKAVDQEIAVVGVGLSPRGNDRPKAKNNISTSPVRFLRALGSWYRSSGRDLPLMDGFSFHPYPNKATDPLDRGYGWPNAGFVNLDRIKQALWDAFHGTAQPTTLEGLKIHLDEVGWQVGTAGQAGYSGLENVVVTDEVTQAAIYADLVRRAACDADIAAVSFFGFRDDGSRTGFQAALQRLDGTARPAAEAVRTAIADSAGGCASAPAPWQPTTGVIGSSLALRPSSTTMSLRLRAGEDARARVCVASAAPRRGDARRGHCRAATLIGHRPVDLEVARPAGTPAGVDVAVELTAEANERRRTVLHRTATASP